MPTDGLPASSLKMKDIKEESSQIMPQIHAAYATNTPFSHRLTLHITAFALALISGFLFPVFAHAGKIENIFSQSTPASRMSIDHSAWTALLAAHIVPAENGLNRLDYKALKAETEYGKLISYIQMLENVNVTKLAKPEQFAFWANLYNAKTVQIILDHYPVASIRDIDISGFFTNGPWGKKVTRVKGISLSLNDIEHTIMRGLWKDPRVHYAVNCASVGCPNLQIQAFTGENLEAQLNKAAIDYINSPRGARLDRKGRLTVSKIYSWYDEDFGNSQRGIITHLKKYAKTPLKEGLARLRSIYDYEYDWSLNDIKR